MKIRNYLFLKASETIIIALVLLGFTLNLNAQITPSLLFSNGMVLQRNVDIPVWGTSKAIETINVTLNGISKTATVGTDGKWKVILPPFEAGGPFVMTIESGATKKTYSDVYIGDVWVASGQSNMELTVSQALDASAQIAAANTQLIREFKVPKATSDEPSFDLPAGSSWKPATSVNVGNFSAVAYYFAKNIQHELNVPIGIINNSYGGARIEAYMSNEMLGFDEQDVVLAGGTYRERQPTVIYNKMLLPLIQFPIKGFLWYQGESNADNMEDALEYGSLFKTMISSWRNLWNMGDLPFLWVQLPNEGEVSTSPGGWDAWPQLRQNQTRALALPETGEAVTIDVGEVDIHPKSKIPVGNRLALIARKQVYNDEIVHQGPRYKSHKLLDGGKISIHFDQIGSGLLAKNSPNNDLTGFAIGTSYESLVWANAKLQGDSVVVWNDDVKSPTVVCYAWQFNPQNLNFYNVADLPAAPFKINVVEPAFSMKFFNSTATTIERGQFAVLSWETYGTSTVTLNDKTVDPISGKRVNPIITTTYELKITDSANTAEPISKKITVIVIDPKPTIAVRTDVGGVTTPETEITLIADALAPKGGSITKVEFLVENKLVKSITTAPYSTKWTTPKEVGEYTITGVVTDNKGTTVTSAPVKIFVTKLKMLVYEAENATYTGTGSIKASALVSGKKYVDLQSGWVLTFDNVEVSEAGSYPLTIRYLTNYEAPKAQILIVNGTSLGEITFTAPNATTWMSYMQNITLNAGKNTIALDDSWGWMSFDYISIAVEDTSTTNGTGDLMQNKKEQNLSVYPNLVDSNATIYFQLEKDSKVILEVFNSTGQKVKTLLNESKPAGIHQLNFDTQKLEQGNYLVKLTTGTQSTITKMILIRQ